MDKIDLTERWLLGQLYAASRRLVFANRAGRKDEAVAADVEIADLIARIKAIQG